MFCVTYLQACEPDALSTYDDVRVVLDDEPDSQGFDRATVIAPTRERLIEYVRENWGDEGSDWFRDYVEARIEECQRRVLVTALVAVPDDFLGSADDLGSAVNEALEVSDAFAFFKNEDSKPRVLSVGAEETPPARYDRAAVVGNVVVSEGADFWTLLEERGYSVQAGQQRTHGNGDDLFFSPYLNLYDPSDPDDGQLCLMYGTDGGGTVYAPDCGDVDELERRLIRALGDSDGWTLDDHGIAVPQERTDG